MESALSTHATLSSSLSLPHRRLSGNGTRGIASFVPCRKVSPAVGFIVRAGSSSSSSHCEPSSSSNASLNITIEPRSSTGKFLKDMFQNQRQLFHVAVGEELKLLAGERDAALVRLSLPSDSHEAVLNRRIAELKEHECQVAAEDVMYMLILHKFSKIRVPLVPKLSKCVHNGRLEILPAKDYELESIHTPEVLEMIKEHVSTTIGLRSDSSSIKDSCETTEIHKSELRQMYFSSILYGYFLKSASVRHGLELCLGEPEPEHHLVRRSRLRRCNLVLDRANELQGSQHSGVSFKSYVMGFDAESLQRCARLRSEEAMSLIERQSCGVFGDGDEEESIVASFSSLRSLVLEAAAFGRFLWDSEEYVDSVFKLT